MAPTSGYAATVIRELYGGSLPRAAEQLLRDHSKTRSSSAPPTAPTWSTSLGERSERRQVEIRVPKVGTKSSSEARPPRMPMRRPLSQILQDTGNYDLQSQAPAARGRDNAEEKRRLQDRRGQNFGGALLAAGPSEWLSAEVPPARASASALTKDEKLAEGIVRSVQERQRELEAIEENLAKCTELAELPGEGAERRRLIRKQMINASQKRMELKSAIARDVKDLALLMDL